MIYTVLIVAFTFFYALFRLILKIAENLQNKEVTFSRVRPGKGTEEYVSAILMLLKA